MKTKYIFTILLCLVAVFGSTQVIAQEETEVETIYPYIDFKYLKSTNNEQILNARVVNSTELGEIPLPGILVKFYTNMEDVMLLGEAVSNIKGIASFVIPEGTSLMTDEEGNWWFSAESETKDNIEATSSELNAMDVVLGMTLTENEDEGRLVNLTAYRVIDGERVPVSDEDVYVFVPRMFSLLPIGEAYLEDGKATIEFPDDIRGDIHGGLTVIGRFNDHWQFGNVEKRIEASWGIPSSHEVAESHRALWTQVAPLWMVITLSIMLAGVWGHYIFAMVSLYRIRKAGRKIKS